MSARPAAAGRRAAALVWALAVANVTVAAVVIGASYVAPASGGPGAQGVPIPDFAAFWAAGRLALEGTPALAYDWASHRAVETAALGAGFEGWAPWHYPPPFLLIVTPFAALPIWLAMAAWVGSTLALYLWTCWRILPGALAVAAALAAAPTAMILVNGQTGFLTAAVFGLALLALERRPVRAGCLVGLLSIKPHLFLAVPVALAAGSRWRAFAWAAGATAALAVLALAIFGLPVWSEFFTSVTQTSGVFSGEAGKFRMYASLYGFLRLTGLGFMPAVLIHGVLALAVLAALVQAWRRPGLAQALKAALLCFATAAVTPRILNYDLHLLVIGGLFQLRHARVSGFFPGEAAILLGALLAGFVSMLFPPGLAWLLAPALFLACWGGRLRWGGQPAQPLHQGRVGSPASGVGSD